MTIARRTEGLRAPLFYSGVAILLLSGGIAAQTVEISTLEACAKLEGQAQKVACFEAIISGSKTAVPPTSAVAAVAVSEPPAAEIESAVEAIPTVEVAAADSPPVEKAAHEATVPTAAPMASAATTSKPNANTPTTVPPAPVAATSTTTAAVPVADDRLGAEYLEDSDDDEAYSAKVIRVSRNHNKLHYFDFDNGQVWRQLEARTIPYPKNSAFEVIISRGMLGEYRMRIVDNNRTVKIRRVK